MAHIVLLLNLKAHRWEKINALFIAKHLATRCDIKNSPRISGSEITVSAAWKKLILAWG